MFYSYSFTHACLLFLQSDPENQVVYHIDMSTALVSALVGKANTPGFADGQGTLAMFSYPRGVALAGNIAIVVCDKVHLPLCVCNLMPTTIPTKSCP